MSPTAILELRAVRLERPGGAAVAVPELCLEAGTAAVVHGPSGSGKSTLLEGVLGLAREGGAGASVQRVAGSISVLGAEWPPSEARAQRQTLATRIAWIPQDPGLAFDPQLPLGVQLARATPGADASQRREVLDRLDLRHEALLRRAPHAASGGELQRLLVAAALLRRPRLLLADEPTAGLDAPRAAAVLSALRELLVATPDPAAMLLTSHDRSVAAAVGARPFTLAGGRLEPGTPAAPRWPQRRRREATRVESPRLSCRGAVLRAPDRTVLLEGIDLSLHPGEIVALRGPSGSGKSALLRALAGHRPIEAAAGGRLEFLRPRRHTAVQLVFQDAAASLTPHRSARAAWRRVVARSGVARSSASVATSASASEPADLLGLQPADLDVSVEQLSGGERRRVALLRALAANPEVLLLDEPTADLDPVAAVRVVECIAAAVDAGLTAFWATHDDSLIAAVADRTLEVRPAEGDRPAALQVLPATVSASRNPQDD